jgi:O-antigen/teichoic acid export membrane protein
MLFLFILNILFARFYTASESGWIFYLFAINAFIIQFVGYSLESGIAYYSARSEISNGRLFTFSLIWTLIATSITLLVYIIWQKWFPGRVQYPLSYPVTFVCGNILIAFGNAFFYSKYNFVLPNILSLVVNLILIIILVSTHYIPQLQEKIDFIPVYFYSFLAHGVLLFICIIFIFPHIRFSFDIPANEIRKIFRYSSYAFIANLLFIAFTRVDYFFIQRFCSPKDLGNYIQVSKIAQVFFILPSMISTVLFPIIASGSQPEIRHRLKYISVRLLLLYVICCTFLAISGNWLFPWLYGNSFSNMYIPFLLLIPGILSMSVLYPYTAYFSGNNLIKVNIIGSLLAFIFIVIGDAIFVPLYGTAAAALMCSGGYFIYLYYVLSVFNKTIAN